MSHKLIISIIIGIVIGLGITVIIFAWTNPSANPPGGGGVLYYSNGNIGIGTANPGAKLEVAGQIKITDGSHGAGKFLTSDASGLASWQTPPGLPPGISGQTLRHDGTKWVANSVVYNSGTNVGIGTINPTAKLEVAGQMKITGGSPAAGLVLTSDAWGLASWQAISVSTSTSAACQTYLDGYNCLSLNCSNVCGSSAKVVTQFGPCTSCICNVTSQTGSCSRSASGWACVSCCVCRP